MRAAVATLWAPDLRGGARFAWLLSGLVALLLLWEAPRQPLVILLVPLAGIAIVLATRSPAWPLGVATGATLISLLWRPATCPRAARSPPTRRGSCSGSPWR